MVALTNKIRELRFKNGEMTQKQLAECIGISRQTMNAIENRRHAPTIDVAIRIADVFSIPVDQLFDLDYEGKPACRERAATVAVERPKAALEGRVEIEQEVDPAENKAGGKAIFAHLAKVIDS